MKISCYLFLIFLGFQTLMQAQENIFLERSYWRSNPSLAQVKNNISEQNNPAQLNENAFDAVCWALLENVDNEVIKYLLTLPGNEVNKITHDGRTYMFWAAYKANLNIMEFLLQNGADMKVIDSHGNSILTFIASTGQLELKVYDFLMANGASPKQELNRNGANALLLIAPYLKDNTFINYFIQKGISLNSIDQEGNGIFNYAAKGGNITFLQYLISQGVPYSDKNNIGSNAILMATQGLRGHQNNLELYQFLQKNGVAVNVVDKYGKTPLHQLAYNTDDITILNFFVEHGVSVNAKDKEGKTPLINAFERNNPAIAQYFLEKGADIHIKDVEGNNISYYWVESFRKNNIEQFQEKFKILESHNIDFKKLQNNQNTLLHLAVKKNEISLLQYLLPLGININAKNAEGYTALHLAAMKAENDEVLKILLAQGANPKIKTDFEETVLDLAKENELLKKNNISLNFLN